MLEVYEKNDKGRARIRLNQESREVGKAECILIYDEQSLGMIQAGRSIQIKGEVWWPDTATNPGQWDGQQYARIQKIDFYIRASKWEYTEKEGNMWLGVLMKVRSWFSNQIQYIWQGENGEIIKAMLLGDTGTLSENTTELFRKGGISHIIAISGLHLTIISEILEKILKRYQKPKTV